MNPLQLRVRCVVCLLASPLGLLGADPTPTPKTELPERVPPQPALIAFAAAHQIPLDGIELTNGKVAGAPGDAVTALVTLREKRDVKQWLLHFEIAPMTEKERFEDHGAEMSLTTPSYTHKFNARADLALEIRTAGPFISGEKPPTAEKQARAVISSEFLAMGLDQSVRAFLKYQSPSSSGVQGAIKPPVLSEHEERVMLGIVPALVAFFQGVQGTPGLSEILWDISEMPSVWSIVKRGGKISPNFNIDEDYGEVPPAAWTIPGRQLYYVGLAVSLNDQPTLRATLVVTSPRPPLLNTAGIVGILARPPAGGPDKRLDIQILAAHRGRGVPESVTANLR